MCYLTLRVVSPPRPLLAVAALRRVPAYNYNKPYTQNSEKPEPYYTLPASAGIVQHVAWCIGYPIPCLGKASDPLCLGGGLARCVSAGSCGCVLVRDRVTRCCMGVGEVHASRLVPVIVCIVGLWAWWGFDVYGSELLR
jgi:hypothetical protein